MFQKGRRVPYIKVIPVVFIAFVLYRIVNDPSIVINGFSYVLSLMSYFLWAFTIAYFLNPLMILLEKKLKIKRILSISIIYTVLLAILIIGITVISPILFNNIEELWDNMPKYIDSTNNWVLDIVDKLKSKDKYNIEPFIVDKITELWNQTNKSLQFYLNLVIRKTAGLASGMLSFLFGLIISVYLLNDKEPLIRNIKKLLYAFLNKKTAYRTITVSRKVNTVFSRFILGKTIDSVIIGLICLIVLSIFRMPFALLISLIIGITNMIPYLGPFIGAIPAVILTLFIDPIKALWVGIFILILQQFDGWYLGPKIIGDQVGISPLLIMTAIIIGGGTFGVMGIFLGVPIFAVIKLFLDEYVEKKLGSNNISLDSEELK